MQKVQAFDATALKQWFLEVKRDFPWRQGPSPYTVWVSEIMLQQTQASVVVPYFLRWMQRFPTIHSLAEASLQEVIKMWEGLGYYSRARHLHQGAIYFVREHGGKIPPHREELAKVKGLGPYTIGAILSFAFHQKHAAIDANGTRVLARYFGIKEAIDTSSGQRLLWQLAQEILPQEQPWLIVEGLIELGATVCTRQPQCLLCPIKRNCLAYRQGIQTDLPIKKRGQKITLLERQVFVIYHQEYVLLKKNKKGLMSDLYEFPYVEGESLDFLIPLVFKKKLKEQSHSFTRYKARLFPALWEALEKTPVPDCQWIAWETIHSLPFSSGHRRILNNLKNFNG